MLNILFYFSETWCKASHVQSNFVHNGHARKDFYRCFTVYSFFFWLGTLKIPQHNKLCMHFYISMYIFSNKYKLYALLTYKCFVALLFSLWQYFLSRHSTVCLYLIFPLNCFFFLAKLPNTFQSMCTYVLYMRFQCIKSFVFSLPRHVWSCRTCLLCNKALFSLRLWPQIHLFWNFLFIVF